MATLPDGPTFSDAEYRRRWQAVAGQLPAYGIDAIAVTGPLNVPYLAGYDDDGMWPSPVIITADAAPVFIARDYDADTIRAESRIPNLLAAVIRHARDHMRVFEHVSAQGLIVQAPRVKLGQLVPVRKDLAESGYHAADLELARRPDGCRSLQPR